MREFIKVCEQAARAGGQILVQLQGKIRAKEKAPNDLVTEADYASQQVIRNIVLGAFPEHEFLGEEDISGETGQQAGRGRSMLPQGYRWVVDPLDGTTNYVHQLPTYCVSVALERAGDLLVGAIFDPTTNECFTAERGRGAQLNGSRLETSSCQRLQEALVAASFSANVPRGSYEVTRFIEVLHSCRALRRMGSAALNLCYVAAGRLDAYWATSVSAWDVAAGVLLIREAGGIVTGVDGTPFALADPQFAAAATPSLHSELVSTLNRDR